MSVRIGSGLSKSLEHSSAEDVRRSSRIQHLKFAYSRDSTQVELANKLARSSISQRLDLPSGDNERRNELRLWLSRIHEQPLDPRNYVKRGGPDNTGNGFHRSVTVEEGKKTNRDFQYSYRTQLEPVSMNFSNYKDRPSRGIYDIRSNEQNVSIEEGTPGPNAYQVLNNTILDRLKKRPGITFKGRHGSQDIEKSGSPGPADYSTCSSSWRPAKDAFTITRSKRTILSPEMIAIPGPGTYESKPIPKPVGTVPFNRSNSNQKQELSPGPGAYDTLRASEKLKLAPKYRFGSSPRFRLLHEGPSEYKTKVGPFSYKPDVRAVKQRIPAVKFGSEAKGVLQVDHEVPGTGKYNIRNDSLDHRGIKFVKERRFLRKVGMVR